MEYKVEKGLRYLSHMFLAMDQHLEYKNMIVYIYIYIYIYENLTKFTLGKDVYHSKFLFLLEKNQRKKSMKTYYF